MSTVAGSDLTRAATSRTLEGPQHIHYHCAGQGDGLLLLHGSGPGVSGWANFGPNLPVFAEHYSVLIPDLPGFGESYRPDLPAPYFAVAVEAILRTLDTEGLERVSVVGNSLGGGIALQLTLDHPDRVHDLVLMGPGGASPALLTPLPTEGIRLLVEFCEDPSRDRLVRWMRSMVGDQAFLTEERIEDRWAVAREPGAIDFIRDFFRMAMSAGAQPQGAAAPVWARLGEIHQRVLLAYGRDDRVTPLDGALHPLRNIRNAELHVFPNCGHWAMQERQSDFERVVLEFLTRGRAS
jgi:4,5:9,10-diseco-3-hydroxy-5,9,17-trioxoandrosta-1(10),2-diene-4-oate hydrolase